MTATPPFAIAETTPQDNDVASAFPGTERTYRDVVESWLLAISSNFGYARVPVLTTTQQDTEINWAVGNVIYNSTIARLRAVASIGPVVWADAIGASDNFPLGTRLPFQQTSAPTGWTKDINTAYNNVAVRLTTGTVTGGGSVPFTTAFASQAVAGSNAQSNVNMAGVTVTIPKAGWTGTGVWTNGLLAVESGSSNPTSNQASDRALTPTGVGVSDAQVFTGSPINLAVQYTDFIIAQKN